MGGRRRLLTLERVLNRRAFLRNIGLVAGAGAVAVAVPASAAATLIHHTPEAPPVEPSNVQLVQHFYGDEVLSAEKLNTLVDQLNRLSRRNGGLRLDVR